uniref:AAA domain-containing protein, putative AbiEii toxin, Type IV TA system n=1 Tax=Candidatus Kentrum sp. LFY TaxID=2126342 RepID=A0A450UJH0_9GAMM|nr:MAG: AAA domain-containing protein, putative AbiEii toxin, Type IV TA system [Candidatus Kentron sp. LFY]
MKIESLEYIDHASGWRLEKTDFDRLTLLVGASGVGKSRILEAILHLRQIAGIFPLPFYSSNGVEWNIGFSTSSGHVCEWSGRFESGNPERKTSQLGFLSIIGNIKNEGSFNLEFERVAIDGSSIVERRSEGILFKGKETVKLSRKKSVFDLLREEEEIKGIRDEFQKILFHDSGPNKGLFNIINPGMSFDVIADPEREFVTLGGIRESDDGIRNKFYLAYANGLSVFDDIKGILMEVFPYIQDIRMELSRVKDIGFPANFFSQEVQEAWREIDSHFPRLQIKEIGVTDWIGEERISSGMLKTLLHIAELYLCADHSLILIDEFENSLGVNCIDEMTSTMLAPERNLQFILTSHHPYIINNIGPEYWKVVTRKGSVVTTRDAAALGIGKSKHEAFIQLINREEYSEGVTA